MVMLTEDTHRWTPPERDDRVRSLTHLRERQVPSTIVVVLFQTDRQDFRRVLSRLSEQTTDVFDVVLVDNGTEWDVLEAVNGMPCVSTYVELRRNYGVTAARNIGAAVASGELLVFLDDDALPASDFVEQHARIHRERDVLAVRGRVIPRTDCIYNRLQTWYDLGDNPMPYFINIEGNASFRADAFAAAQGFDETLEGRAGHEGIELSYRLTDRGESIDALLYHPGPVVYHDYATSLRGYVNKVVHARKTRTQLRNLHPAVFEFTNQYPEQEPTSAGLSRIDRLKQMGINAAVELASLRA